MEDISINVLVDAKNEYTTQLTNILTPHLYTGALTNIYNKAVELTAEEEDHIATFKTLLKNVPKWNQNVIEEVTEYILDKSQCKWLDDLLTAVFMSNARILTAVRTHTPKNKRLDLTIPTTDHFIHQCYIEIAREMYKNPYLFDVDQLNSNERHRNMRETLELINNCIHQAVRKLLPVQTILKQYLGHLHDDDDISVVSSVANDDVKFPKPFRRPDTPETNDDLSDIISEQDEDESTSQSNSSESESETDQEGGSTDSESVSTQESSTDYDRNTPTTDRNTPTTDSDSDDDVQLLDKLKPVTFPSTTVKPSTTPKVDYDPLDPPVQLEITKSSSPTPQPSSVSVTQTQEVKETQEMKETPRSSTPDQLPLPPLSKNIDLSKLSEEEEPSVPTPVHTSVPTPVLKVVEPPVVQHTLPPVMPKAEEKEIILVGGDAKPNPPREPHSPIPPKVEETKEERRERKRKKRMKLLRERGLIVRPKPKRNDKPTTLPSQTQLPPQIDPTAPPVHNVKPTPPTPVASTVGRPVFFNDAETTMTDFSDTE